MEMSDTSFTLAPDGSAEITVTVHIPPDAVIGDWDEGWITATSQSDPDAWDESVLTTYASEVHLFLPMVSREP